MHLTVAAVVFWSGLVVGEAGSASGGGASKASATVNDAASKCHAPFRFESKNETLQTNLERALREEGWQKWVDKKLLAAAVVDLTRRGQTYYAGVNDDVMMYAASLPKIAILLAVVEAAEQGKLNWDHEYDVRLQAMITASSNPDASWGTDLVGLLAIENTMRDPRYCLYDEEHGGLWVGRAYRSGGATNRDPRFEITHGATTRQVARYYTMLDAGKLVSRHWSFRMLGLMSPPKHFHKFVGGLTQRPGVVFLARKSGTWRTYHADSILVQHNDLRYVLVGLAELRDGEQVMRKLAQRADDIIQKGEHRVAPKKKRVARTRGKTKT